jgi:hypothetical protein
MSDKEAQVYGHHIVKLFPSLCWTMLLIAVTPLTDWHIMMATGCLPIRVAIENFTMKDENVKFPYWIMHSIPIQEL